MERFGVRTSRRCELIDITGEVAGAVERSGVAGGVVVVYCPHTTAGITINENADPSVRADICMKTSKLIEEHDQDYRHAEGNSDAHVKSSLVGASETVVIDGGRLMLGRWQAIYFAEFDGPRSREVYLKIIGQGG
ncbi:MAG: secondary thiamine-phosphate synthase enzyme YjbQ [Thermodesulfobacteriota bacterium]